MPLDPSFLDAIKGFEGFSPQASWDYKQHSNGYGTRALYPGEKIDKDTAEARFQAEIAKAAAHVDQIAPTAPPGARAALVSLTYNAGPGWTTSGLGELVKAGDWNAASQRLTEYNKAGGQVNPGLVQRRATEAGWFNAHPLGGAPQMAARTVQASASPSMPAYPWSPGQQQQAASGYEQQPPMEAAPQFAAMPMIGLPRKPPDFKRMMAMFKQARSTNRA